MFRLNTVTIGLLVLIVPQVAVRTLVPGGIGTGAGVAVLLVLTFALMAFLLSRIRCPHCERRLTSSPFSLRGGLFWQRYLFLGGRCPHCDRPAGGWWF